MKALIKKNQILRNNYKKFELNSYIHSALTKNLLTLYNNGVGKFDKPNLSFSAVTPSNHSPVGVYTLPYISKIRNICVLTGRSRAINNTYKLSRLKFKLLAETGNLYGVIKQ